MKKTLLSIATALIFSLISFAQTPQAIKYQAVARDISGNILDNQSVSFQISILQGSSSGSAVYAETHTATTNDFGLVNLEIGGGTVVSGDFTTIGWESDLHFVKIEMDETGGASYQLMGVSQLLSVPYAMHAKTVEIDNVNDADADSTNELQTLSFSNDTLYLSKSNSVVLPSSSGSGGKTYLYLSGDITNAEAAAKIANEVGENTQFVTINNTTQLTYVDLSGITELVEVDVRYNDALTSLLMPALVSTGGQVIVANNNALTSLSFPALTSSGVYFNVTYNDALTSLSIPALISFANNFSVSNNALSSTTINDLLAQLAAIAPAITGKSIYMENQTPPAPPTGQGVTDKATLISNGNIVSTD